MPQVTAVRHDLHNAPMVALDEVLERQKRNELRLRVLLRTVFVPKGRQALLTQSKRFLGDAQRRLRGS
jgi:hypothetical protein